MRINIDSLMFAVSKLPVPRVSREVYYLKVQDPIQFTGKPNDEICEGSIGFKTIKCIAVKYCVAYHCYLKWELELE